MLVNEKLHEFEKKLGYEFKDKALLRMALTHKSFAFEHSILDKGLYNERIEYLGDAILGHIIAELLYMKNPPISEGDMSKKRAEIVCEKSLCDAFSVIGADDYIFVGKCEKNGNQKRKDAIIADAFEAVLGAIYLDSDFSYAKNVAIKLLEKQIEDTISGKTKIVDYKSKLQELLYKHETPKIEYVITKEEGPDHEKLFYMDVLVNGKVQGSGKGKNKQIASQEAAHIAYDKLK